MRTDKSIKSISHINQSSSANEIVQSINQREKKKERKRKRKKKVGHNLPVLCEKLKMSHNHKFELKNNQKMNAYKTR